MRDDSSPRPEPQRGATRHRRRIGQPRWAAAAGDPPTVRAAEVLGRIAMGRMLAGLPTRRYPVELEPVSEKVQRVARSTCMSAVSRRFVAATETALTELLAAPLGERIW